MRRLGLLRSLMLLGVSVVLLGGCFESNQLQGGEGDESRVRAPEFDLTALDGGSIQLSELRGKIVILDFWATWCAPCEIQMPVLDTFWKERRTDDFMIVGISVDTDTTDEVAAWVAERGFDYPIAIGDHDLAMRYGVIGFPTLVFVDATGAIHQRHTGVWSGPEIETALDAIRSEMSSDG